VAVLRSIVPRRVTARYQRVYIPLGTLVTAWEFLRANGTRGREQLCFLAGRVVEGASGAAAQVTCCVLPLTVANDGYVTLTSHAQAARILDELEARDEVPIFSLHTHGDGAPAHSEIDDRGVALGPEDGVFSGVIPHYALGSPFEFPRRAAVYERVGGVWRRLAAEERDARVVVHGDTLRFVRAPAGEEP
jgi:hypothetical protein